MSTHYKHHLRLINNHNESNQIESGLPGKVLPRKSVNGPSSLHCNLNVLDVIVAEDSLRLPNFQQTNV
jgi:hypothetical protein